MEKAKASRLVSLLAAMTVAIALAGCGKTGKSPSAPNSDPLDGLSWLEVGHKFGSTSMLLERGGLVVYVDPARVNGVESLPKADYILITHSHTDHFMPGTIMALAKKGTVIVCASDSAFPLNQAKIGGTRVVKPGDVVKGRGIVVEAVPMFTVSPDLGNHPSHLESMGWTGFLVTLGGAKYYFSGDSELTKEMETLSGIDVAVIDLSGPYAGKGTAAWANVVKPAFLVPAHWTPGDAAGMKDLEDLAAGLGAGVTLVKLEKRK